MENKKNEIVAIKDSSIGVDMHSWTFTIKFYAFYKEVFTNANSRRNVNQQTDYIVYV